MTDGSANARNQLALMVDASDRPPFGAKDDIRRERKPPDRNLLDRDRIVDGLRQWGIVIVFVAIVVTFSFLRPTTFMTFQNVINVVNNSSSLLLFALAATLALAIGEFDLSFVAVADLVAVLIGVVVTSFGWTSGFGIAGALALGSLVARRSERSTASSSRKPSSLPLSRPLPSARSRPASNSQPRSGSQGA